MKKLIMAGAVALTLAASMPSASAAGVWEVSAHATLPCFPCVATVTDLDGDLTAVVGASDGIGQGTPIEYSEPTCAVGIAGIPAGGGTLVTDSGSEYDFAYLRVGAVAPVIALRTSGSQEQAIVGLVVFEPDNIPDTALRCAGLVHTNVPYGVSFVGVAAGA
ncbi:MAG TPA: hypothetical protein VGB83_07175 [Actinomycetota bacterium]